MTTQTHAATTQLDQFEAAKTGNLQWFKQQHAAGTLPDLTVADAQDRFILEYAAENGHLSVVKYFIEECTQDVNAISCDNYAIHLAAENGHLDVVKYLIEDSDQNVDATTLDNYAIRFAAENGHLDVVKYLIEDSGQDVDVTALDNCALRFAAANGHFDVVKYLIEDCPQPIDLSVLGRKFLQIAAEYEHVDLVEYLSSICEAIENIDLIIYKKIRPVLLKSASQLPYAEQLYHLAALPDGVLQTLSTSVEGLQQLRVYLQKTSNNEACVLATTTRTPRL